MTAEVMNLVQRDRAVFFNLDNGGSRMFKAGHHRVEGLRARSKKGPQAKGVPEEAKKGDAEHQCQRCRTQEELEAGKNERNPQGPARVPGPRHPALLHGSSRRGVGGEGERQVTVRRGGQWTVR